MAIGHYGRNMMTTKTIKISQTTTDKNGNTNLIPRRRRLSPPRWMLAARIN